MHEENCRLFLGFRAGVQKCPHRHGCGLFAALAFILESFSIQLGESIKIGFSGLPNEMVDFLFGPAVGCVFSGMMDILKLIVHPTGPWIPGLTLNSFLAGLVYGFFPV